MSRIPRDIKRKLRDDALKIDPNFKDALKNQLFIKEKIMAKPSSIQKVAAFFKQNNAVPLTAVFIAMVAVGSASALVTNNRAEQARQSEIELPSDLESILSVDAIQIQALADEPNLTVVSIELENEDEGLLYKVRYSDGSVRFYDSKTGAAVARNQNAEVDESVPSDFVAGISINQARQVAQNQRPGKTITKIEIETENGVVVYSFRFSDNGRVDVNASNGSVLRVRGVDGQKQGSSTDDSSDDSSSDDHEDSSDSESDDADEVDEKDDSDSIDD